jgi:hypothetical protein
VVAISAVKRVRSHSHGCLTFIGLSQALTPLQQQQPAQDRVGNDRGDVNEIRGERGIPGRGLACPGDEVMPVSTTDNARVHRVLDGVSGSQRDDSGECRFCFFNYYFSDIILFSFLAR